MVLGTRRPIIVAEVMLLDILEIVLAAPMRSRAFGFLLGFGLIRLIISIALAAVLIWLLLKIIKLVDAYTKKLK